MPSRCDIIAICAGSSVTYTSEDDYLELKHSITNRRALAMGAVIAGEYLKDKQGVHTMDNLL